MCPHLQRVGSGGFSDGNSGGGGGSGGGQQSIGVSLLGRGLGGGALSRAPTSPPLVRLCQPTAPFFQPPLCGFVRRSCRHVRRLTFAFAAVNPTVIAAITTTATTGVAGVTRVTSVTSVISPTVIPNSGTTIAAVAAVTVTAAVVHGDTACPWCSGHDTSDQAMERKVGGEATAARSRRGG